MLEVLSIVAGSWPIAFMATGLGTAFMVNRRVKQSMDNNDTIRALSARSALVVHDNAG